MISNSLSDIMPQIPSYIILVYAFSYIKISQKLLVVLLFVTHTSCFDLQVQFVAVTIAIRFKCPMLIAMPLSKSIQKDFQGAKERGMR